MTEKKTVIKIILFGIIGAVLGGLLGYHGILLILIAIFPRLEQGGLIIFLTGPLGIALGFLSGLSMPLRNKWISIDSGIGAFTGLIIAAIIDVSRISTLHDGWIFSLLIILGGSIGWLIGYLRYRKRWAGVDR